MRLRVHDLLPGDSPRSAGVVGDHVQVLAGSDREFPPIVVHRGSMRVIDGMHRLRAAALRGDELIDARYFDGSAEDAFVLAVRENVGHGLPLNSVDRSAAAERIMRSFPGWSNRLIAHETGLSATFVAGLRERLADLPGDTLLDAGVRLGRDGRMRPVNAARGRQAVATLLRERPGASLRQVARAAGVAPSTALDVRNRLAAGQDPVPDRLLRSRRGVATPHEVPTPVTESVDSTALLGALRKDPGLRFMATGRALLMWLGARPNRQDMRKIVERVPPHCAAMIVQVALDNAQTWQEFAHLVNQTKSMIRAREA